MYLIPLIRTSRAFVATTIFPDNPLFAITSSEIISFIIPFINNNPLYAVNNMVLFIIYYFNYNEYAIDIMEKYKNKYFKYYLTEIISILLYIFNYYY